MSDEKRDGRTDRGWALEEGGKQPSPAPPTPAPKARKVSRGSGPPCVLRGSPETPSSSRPGSAAGKCHPRAWKEPSDAPRFASSMWIVFQRTPRVEAGLSLGSVALKLWTAPSWGRDGDTVCLSEARLPPGGGSSPTGTFQCGAGRCRYVPPVTCVWMPGKHSENDAAARGL